MSRAKTMLLLAGLILTLSGCYYYGPPGYYGPGYYHHPHYYWGP